MTPLSPIIHSSFGIRRASDFTPIQVINMDLSEVKNTKPKSGQLVPLKLSHNRKNKISNIM